MWRSHKSQEIIQQADNSGEQEEQFGQGSKAIKSWDI
jgi:hypothetical protein